MGKKNKVGDGERLDDDSENSGKYGKPVKYDPTFKGPIENRSCTDVICCILFIACICGLAVVGYLGWSQGNPLSLIYPTDSYGNICGVTESVKDKPHLYFFDFLECITSSTTLLNVKCPTQQICVSQCPNKTAVPYKDVVLALAANNPLVNTASLISWDDFICDYGFDPQAEYLTGDYGGYDGLLRMFEEDKCASYIIPQRAYLDRCLPAFLVDSLSTVENVLSSDEFILTPSGENVTASNAQSLFENAVNIILDLTSLFETIYQDVVASWHVMLIGLGIGMILAFLFIILMRWLAGVIVWFTIFALWAVLGVGIYYCFTQYTSLAGVDGADAAITFTSDLSSYARLQQTWLIVGIILAVILAILLLMTLCLCTRIRIAISLIKEASKAIGHMISTLFWPIVPFILEVCIVALWAAIAVYLATSHRAMYVVVDAPSDFAIANGTSCEPDTFVGNNTTAHCNFNEYALPDYTIYLQFYNLFMFFWLVNFMIALGQVTLAGAFASYYWAFTKPQDIPAFPLFKGFWRSIRYHLGSIAFGSLIIAIIQIIRVMLEYVEQKLKGKADNDIIKYIIKCLKCCFWCLEKIMKFLNKNAYILIAIYGKNFCSSAKQAFFLLLRNIVRVAVVNKLTDFVIFLGMLLVTGAVGVASFFYFTNQITFLNDVVSVPDLTYYWVPIIVITIGTFFISWCFFGVYDMAVDTLFLCFLEDLERHDGSAEKPYYMSKELMNIVGKKNKIEKDD